MGSALRGEFIEIESLDLEVIMWFTREWKLNLAIVYVTTPKMECKTIGQILEVYNSQAFPQRCVEIGI